MSWKYTFNINSKPQITPFSSNPLPFFSGCIKLKIEYKTVVNNKCHILQCTPHTISAINRILLIDAYLVEDILQQNSIQTFNWFLSKSETLPIQNILTTLISTEEGIEEEERKFESTNVKKNYVATWTWNWLVNWSF